MISKSLIAFLSSWIIENTEFNKKISDPDLFKLTKKEMSDKACFSSSNCKVKAYYVKSAGIYYIDQLEPEPVDFYLLMIGLKKGNKTLPEMIEGTRNEISESIDKNKFNRIRINYETTFPYTYKTKCFL